MLANRTRPAIATAADLLAVALNAIGPELGKGFLTEIALDKGIKLSSSYQILCAKKGFKLPHGSLAARRYVGGRRRASSRIRQPRGLKLPPAERMRFAAARAVSPTDDQS